MLILRHATLGTLGNFISASYSNIKRVTRNIVFTLGVTAAQKASKSRGRTQPQVKLALASEAIRKFGDAADGGGWTAELIR